MKTNKRMSVYDFIVIGGGPGGMSLATMLPGKIALFEKEEVLGGCHKVIRNDGLFTEHGPRIYGTSYINSIALLKTIGMEWSDYMVPYTFQFLSSNLTSILPQLTLQEIYYLGIGFVNFSFGLLQQNKSVQEWAVERGFSEKSMDLLDSLCRMSDGADKTRYLMSSFFDVINQNFFYSFQQPSKPNDQGLIKDWEDKLVKKGVDIFKKTEVTSVLPHMVSTDTGTFSGKKIIFAMPPQYMVNIINKSSYNPFPDWIYQYAKETAYIKYICLTFHYKEKLTLDQIWGIARDSKWGIVFIKISDYQKVEPNYNTIFTIAITKIDTIGLNGKMASDCTEDEIKDEVFAEMNNLFHFPNEPDKILIYSGNDQAWVHTKAGYRNFQNDTDEIYASATHMGKSTYNFTSFESAVSNAIWLCNYLTKSNRKILGLWTLAPIVVFLVLFFICLFIYWIIKIFY